MKASGTVRRARWTRESANGTQAESGAAGGGMGHVGSARSWLGPARAAAPSGRQYGGHRGSRVGRPVHGPGGLGDGGDRAG